MKNLSNNCVINIIFSSYCIITLLVIASCNVDIKSKPKLKPEDADETNKECKSNETQSRTRYFEEKSDSCLEENQTRNCTNLKWGDWSGTFKFEACSKIDNSSEHKANFTVDKEFGVSPFKVKFSDSTDGNIIRWEWDFNNDGRIDSTKANPEFVFEEAGTYTISLNVFDENGTNNKLVKTDLITVYNKNSTHNPPYIEIKKPIASKVVIIDDEKNDNGDISICLEGCNYNSLKQFELAEVTAGTLIRMKSGTYKGGAFSTKAEVNKEVVWEAFGDGKVYIKASNPYQQSCFVMGEHIIFDGGPNKDIVFDGTGNTVSGSFSLYILGSYLAFSRVEVINPNNPKSRTTVVIKAGQDIKIYNSEIHLGGVGIYNRKGVNIFIRNNLIYDNYGTGIQANPHKPTEEVTNLVISGNLIYNNGYEHCRPGIVILHQYADGGRMYSSSIYNNFIWDNGKDKVNCTLNTGGIQVRDIINSIDIYNNTVYDNQAHGIRIHAIFDGATANLKNNIVFNNTYDLQIKNDVNQAANVSNNVISDPIFMSIDPNSSDFLQISAKSVDVLGKGINLSNIVDIDFFGTSRPQGGEYDIGAHEYFAH